MVLSLRLYPAHVCKGSELCASMTRCARTAKSGARERQDASNLFEAREHAVCELALCVGPASEERATSRLWELAASSSTGWTPYGLYWITVKMEPVSSRSLLKSSRPKSLEARKEGGTESRQKTGTGGNAGPGAATGASADNSSQRARAPTEDNLCHGSYSW